MAMRSIQARIIERHFFDYGGETENIFLFEGMLEIDRSELMARLAITSAEEPVIVARLYPEGRLILCSHCIVVDLPSGIRKVPYSSIVDVKKDLQRELLLRRWKKSEWRTLVVKFATGEELNLETEPGKGFFGVLNAFMFQAHRAWRIKNRDRGDTG